MATSSNKRDGTAPEEAFKSPVLINTVSDITLVGEQTVNTVDLIEGNRVLVVAQTDASENGIYNVSGQEWVRAIDWDDDSDLVNGTLIKETTLGELFQANFSGDFEVGVTPVTFLALLGIGVADGAIASADAAAQSESDASDSADAAADSASDAADDASAVSDSAAAAATSADEAQASAEKAKGVPVYTYPKQFGASKTVGSVNRGNHMVAYDSTSILMVRDGINTIERRIFNYQTKTWGNATTPSIVFGTPFTRFAIDVLTHTSPMKIAFWQNGTNELGLYEESGGTFVLVGNLLPLVQNNVNRNFHLAGLDSNTIVISERGVNRFQAYRHDGVDWATAGNNTNISGSGDVRDIKALGPARAVYATDSKAEVITFDETDWSEEGSGTGNDWTSNGTGSAFISIDVLNAEEDIVIIRRSGAPPVRMEGDQMEIYRWQVNDQGLSYDEISRNTMNVKVTGGLNNSNTVAVLNGEDMAVHDEDSLELRLLKYSFHQNEDPVTYHRFDPNP